MSTKEILSISFFLIMVVLVGCTVFIKITKQRKPPEYCILFEDIKNYVDFLNENYKGIFYIQLTRVVSIGYECCQLTFHSYEFDAHVRCCPFYSLQNQFNKRYYYIDSASLFRIDDFVNHSINFFDSLKDYKCGVKRRYYELKLKQQDYGKRN